MVDICGAVEIGRVFTLALAFLREIKEASPAVTEHLAVATVTLIGEVADEKSVECQKELEPYHFHTPFQGNM